MGSHYEQVVSYRKQKSCSDGPHSSRTVTISDSCRTNRMNLWSTVRPRRSGCLHRCLGPVGTREPAARSVHQKGCGLRALQRTHRQNVNAQGGVSTTSCSERLRGRSVSPLVPKLIMMSAVPRCSFLKVRGVTSAQTFKALRMARSTSDFFRSGV